MRLNHAALIALVIAPVLAIAQEKLGTYEDRIAVEDVMARYVWSVDSLDADGYVAVFTEDAVIDSNGSISRGHEEIRKVVTNLIKRRDDNKAKGLPAGNLYHVISNVRITFPKANEAVHQSYWQTVRRDKDVSRRRNATCRWLRDIPATSPPRNNVRDATVMSVNLI